MKDKKDLIGEDFEGFPIYKMNIREILEKLCKHENGNYLIKDDDPRLDIYPVTMEDDAMGYGINEKFITCVSFGKRENDKDYCNIFIDKKLRLK